MKVTDDDFAKIPRSYPISAPPETCSKIIRPIESPPRPESYIGKTTFGSNGDVTIEPQVKDKDAPHVSSITFRPHHEDRLAKLESIVMELKKADVMNKREIKWLEDRLDELDNYEIPKLNLIISRQRGRIDLLIKK